jgi:hypothetical protein
VIRYLVRIPGGAMCFASALSAQDAAESVIGRASPQPPADDPQRLPDCLVWERGSSATEQPFWRAEGVAQPDQPEAV